MKTVFMEIKVSLNLKKMANIFENKKEKFLSLVKHPTSIFFRMQIKLSFSYNMFGYRLDFFFHIMQNKIKTLMKHYN